MMFFREIAIEYEKRSRVLSKLNTADFQINENGHCFPKANPLADGPVSPNQLRDACEMLPELDIMVLRANFADLPHDSWKPPYNIAPSIPLIDEVDIPNPRHEVSTSDDLFHVYHCSTLRSGVSRHLSVDKVESPNSTD